MRPATAPAVLAGCLLLVSCGLMGPHRSTAAERQTLVGTDADGDGVRDDVGDAIGHLPGTETMRAYLLETARVEQRIMQLDTVGSGARDRAYAIAQEANRLISCVPDGLDVHDAWDRADAIQSLVEDTPDRRAHVDEFASLLNGRDFPEPDC